LFDPSEKINFHRKHLLVPGVRKKHFKMKSEVKVILRNIYIALESPESTDEIKYEQPRFIGHAPKM